MLLQISYQNSENENSESPEGCKDLEKLAHSSAAHGTLRWQAQLGAWSGNEDTKYNAHIPNRSACDPTPASYSQTRGSHRQWHKVPTPQCTRPDWVSQLFSLV